MQDLIDFIMKMVLATLFIYLVNEMFVLEIPYHWFYLILVAFLGIKGMLAVLLLHFFV